MGWTRKTAAATLLLMTEQQKREMAQRVSQLRDARGMTNESLARAAGMSTKTISRLVNGKHEPRIDTIERVARALGVPEREIRGAPVSPFGDSPASGEQVDQVAVEFRDHVGDMNADLAVIIRRQDEMMRALERARLDREAIVALLARQSEILESIERVVASQLRAAQLMEEAAALLHAVRERPESPAGTRPTNVGTANRPEAH